MMTKGAENTKSSAFMCVHISVRSRYKYFGQGWLIETQTIDRERKPIFYSQKVQKSVNFIEKLENQKPKQNEKFLGFCQDFVSKK